MISHDFRQVVMSAELFELHPCPCPETCYWYSSENPPFSGGCYVRRESRPGCDRRRSYSALAVRDPHCWFVPAGRYYMGRWWDMGMFGVRAVELGYRRQSTEAPGYEWTHIDQAEHVVVYDRVWPTCEAVCAPEVDAGEG